MRAPERPSDAAERTDPISRPTAQATGACQEPQLIAAWPRVSRVERRRFELLKRAYVEARYSSSYAIDREDIDAVAASVRTLRDLVERLCRERLANCAARLGSEVRSARRAGACGARTGGLLCSRQRSRICLPAPHTRSGRGAGRRRTQSSARTPPRRPASRESAWPARRQLIRNGCDIACLACNVPLLA